MNTTEKGDKLEDKLYEYLLDQYTRDALVYGLHPASICEIRKKPKYYCREREAHVNFDVVVELRRQGGTSPHSYLVFECKNHERPLEDSYVRNFSDQLSSVFGHAAKGVVVTSSRLQSGANAIARNRGLGIAKFDENGIDVVADRTVGAWAENRFVQTQFFSGPRKPKSLKFSAFIEGQYFGSFYQILESFCLDSTDVRTEINDQKAKSVAFLESV